MSAVGPVGDPAIRPEPVGPPAVGEARPDPAAERDAWAVLAAVDRLGPVAFAALLARYGSGAGILADAALPGGIDRLAATPPLEPAERGDDGQGRRPIRRPVGRALASAIAERAQDAPAILTRLRELGVQVVTLDSAAYPSRLAGIAMPPHVLFVTGRVPALSRPRAVAIVGTRRATSQGRTVAGRIAHGLVAADATVVSGLAYGIDGAAHAATLGAGGTTVAVIGGGHACLGPRAHLRLAEAIVQADGAIVSEYAPDVEPTAGTFPRRNRIISGLASATVVVEAPARSGALITASWALEQGRGCFVVPGPIDAPSTEGCLALLREFPQEVRIVAGIPQLIADLGLAGHPPAMGHSAAAASEAVAAAALQGLGRTERVVAGELLSGRRTVDEMVATTDLPVATVLATLALLERRGLVAGAHGRYRPDGALLGVIAQPEPR